MKHARKILGATVAVGALVALPAASAQAATWNVGAGPGASIAGDMPPGATDNAFYPKKLTVRQGDRVKFAINGFHDVWFPKRGDGPPPFANANPAAPVTGAVDAANAPLWFNGQPGIFIDAALLETQGNGVVDGKAVDASALPGEGGGPPAPYKARFPKKGTFAYYCAIHPGMKGTIKVVGKKKKAPTKKAVNKAIAKQGRKAIRQARKLDGVQPPAQTVQAGSDNSHIAILKFLPGNLNVGVNQPVTFEFSDRSTEIHNVAFGPMDYLGQLVASFIQPGPTGIALNPLVVYPSDPPTGAPIAYTGANHGNGWINTGILDAADVTPFPKSAQVTFDKAGVYRYICVIHGPDMSGTITVG